jgi:hypothetical protein
VPLPGGGTCCGSYLAVQCVAWYVNDGHTERIYLNEINHPQVATGMFFNGQYSVDLYIYDTDGSILNVLNGNTGSVISAWDEINQQNCIQIDLH